MDQSLESGFKSGFVLIGPRLNEVDDLSVIVGGLFVVAADLVDYSQSIVAVVNLRVRYCGFNDVSPCQQSVTRVC